MTRFFTADPHFSHANIIKYCHRPFTDVQEMNEAIVRRWNSVVRPLDSVVVLGDVCLNVNKGLPWVKQLNGTKFLVPGNHDLCWSGMGAKAQKAQERYKDVGFRLLPETLTIGLTDLEEPVVLSHFPYIGDNHDADRYTTHRPVDHGQWLIHGHVHDKWQVRGRQINVGMDVWHFCPVPEEDIVAIIKDDR